MPAGGQYVRTYHHPLLTKPAKPPPMAGRKQEARQPREGGREVSMSNARCDFLGHKFWARGYFVTTVGRDEEVIRAYIRNQELADQQLGAEDLSRPKNPINHPNIP